MQREEKLWNDKQNISGGKIMKYCTNDGKKIFDTKEEVLAYEAKIEEEKRQREIEQKE